MENTINQNNTIKTNREKINRINRGNISRKIKKQNDLLKKTVIKLLVQIFVCIVLITMIYIYKYINNDEFKYNASKYEWIFKYNMTYIDTYNCCVDFLNNKLGFKIPLKDKIIQEEISLINEGNNIENEIEEKMNIEISEPTVLVSTPYNNMEMLANEIKEKYIWVKPTSGTISCKFGNRDASRPDISTFHLGLDIANDIGTEIVSTISGTIVFSGYNETYGNYIKLEKDDVMVIYGHCSKILIKQGQQVKEGEKIALMGDSGIATGPHLHFEVRKNNMVINPEYILDFR